jgi:Fe-S cluster assembly protein SufD
MTAKPETAPFIDAFRARAPGAGEPAWLGAHRQASLAHFGELGFPSRREEAWRFTDLRPVERVSWRTDESAAGVASGLPCYALAGPTHRLVLVAGRVDPGLSHIGRLPAGAWLASTRRTLAERPALLAEALEASDTAGNQPFASLNAAFFADGFVLALEPGVVLDRPVEVVHLGADAVPHVLHLRHLVRLAPGSKATLIESYGGAGAHWTNAVMALSLGDAASLGHARLQDEPGAAIHFALTRAHLARNSRWESFSLTSGALLSRHDILARLAGEGAQLALAGTSLLRGEQEATTAVLVDHEQPGGTTRELFKGVVDDRAHGVFLGTIRVRPGAQKTDAHQLNKNLLLSRRAHVDTKPELEILADDVKCSHGAAVGDLDESALFYLRARGIAEPEARRMLIEAFAADALDTVADADLRAHLAAQVRRWLAAGEAL